MVVDGKTTGSSSVSIEVIVASVEQVVWVGRSLSLQGLPVP